MGVTYEYQTKENKMCFSNIQHTITSHTQNKARKSTCAHAQLNPRVSVRKMCFSNIQQMKLGSQERGGWERRQGEGGGMVGWGGGGGVRDRGGPVQ